MNLMMYYRKLERSINPPYCKHTSRAQAPLRQCFSLWNSLGREIMIHCTTFWATITTICLSDLVPIFIDINPETLNLDLEDTNCKLTKNTKIIFHVHISVTPDDINHIFNFAIE